MRFQRLINCIVVISIMPICVFAEVTGITGQSGQEGSYGEGGNNGAKGTIVFAVGCEDTALKTVGSSFSDGGFEHWADTVKFMCPEYPNLSENLMKQLNAKADAILANLVATNNSLNLKVPKFNIGLDGLKEKFNLMSSMSRSLEEEGKVKLGCWMAADTASKNSSELCFYKELIHISNEGVVTTEYEVTINYYPEKKDLIHNSSKFRVENRLPTCRGGRIPVARIDNQGSSMGEKFTKSVNSNCEGFSVNFSAVYPDFSYVFE